jgi:hypothetical protein
VLELRLVQHLDGEVEGKRGEHLRRGVGAVAVQLVQGLGDVRRTHRGERLGQLGRVAV